MIDYAQIVLIWIKYKSWGENQQYTLFLVALTMGFLLGKTIYHFSDKGYENWAWYSRATTATQALNQWKRSPGHNTLMINAGQWGRIQWRGVGASILGGHAVLWFGDWTTLDINTNMDIYKINNWLSRLFVSLIWVRILMCKPVSFWLKQRVKSKLIEKLNYVQKESLI